MMMNSMSVDVLKGSITVKLITWNSSHPISITAEVHPCTNLKRQAPPINFQL